MILAAYLVFCFLVGFVAGWTLLPKYPWWVTWVVSVTIVTLGCLILEKKGVL